MKRGIATEENIGDDSCTQTENNKLVFYWYMHMEVIILVDQFYVASVLDDFRDNISKRAGKREELLVGRIKAFFPVKR